MPGDLLDRGDAPEPISLKCAKKPAKETHPTDRLSLSGNLANVPLNGARSHSLPAKGCLAGVLPAIPAQAHAREASDQGGPNVKIGQV
jgi:hypothetical protein